MLRGSMKTRERKLCHVLMRSCGFSVLHALELEKMKLSPVNQTQHGRCARPLFAYREVDSQEVLPDSTVQIAVPV